MSRFNRNKLHHKGEKSHHYKDTECLGKYMYVLWYSKMYLFKIPLNRICVGQQRSLIFFYNFKNSSSFLPMFMVLRIKVSHILRRMCQRRVTSPAQQRFLHWIAVILKSSLHPLGNPQDPAAAGLADPACGQNCPLTHSQQTASKRGYGGALFVAQTLPPPQDATARRCLENKEKAVNIVYLPRHP